MKSADNRDTQAAWDYHNGTKHPGGNLMNPNHRFHPGQQPFLFKIYKDLPPIPLPLDPKPSGYPALDAISGGVGARQGDSPSLGGSSFASPHPSASTQPTGESSILDLPTIAGLLHFSAGITKFIRYPEPWGRTPFRAAACTGALYHIELYLVCENLPPSNESPGLAAGVYHYDPLENSLRRLRAGDFRSVLVEASGREPAVASASAALVFTDVFWRNAVKYQAREYRHAFWDSGTILANTLAVAAARGLPAKIILGFVDDEVSQLLDIDPAHELALAMVPLGTARETEIHPAPPVTKLDLEIEPYSIREIDFPPIRAMHAASSLPDVSAVAAWLRDESVGARQEESSSMGRTSFASPLPPSPQPASIHAGQLIPLRPLPQEELPAEPIENVIVRRGSARRFAHEALSFDQLSTVLLRTLTGFEADFPAQITNVYLIANAINGNSGSPGLASGAYFYHRDLRALELLKEGDFRSTAGYLALGQDLSTDASVDIFFLADLREILERFGNRGYRAAQLEAAIYAGRIYLAAYALGFGATGLTFYDDAVTEFFSPHATGKSVMFLIALGKKLGS